MKTLVNITYFVIGFLFIVWVILSLCYLLGFDFEKYSQAYKLISVAWILLALILSELTNESK